MAEVPDNKSILLAVAKLGACVHCVARFLQYDQKDLRSAEEVRKTTIFAHCKTYEALLASLGEEEQVEFKSCQTTLTSSTGMFFVLTSPNLAEICPLCLGLLSLAREDQHREYLLHEIRNSGWQFEDFNVKPAVPNFTLIQDRATLYHLEDTIGFVGTSFLLRNSAYLTVS
jgi:hypothetical protein